MLSSSKSTCGRRRRKSGRKSYGCCLCRSCYWPRRHINVQNQRPRPSPNLLALAVFRAFSRAWTCAKCWCRQHFCVSAKCRNLLSSGSLLSLTLTVYRALLQLTTFTKYCDRGPVSLFVFQKHHADQSIHDQTTVPFVF